MNSSAIAPGDLIELFPDRFGRKCFSIYRQDAGMGEKEYAVFLNDEFLFRSEHHKIARNIVMEIRDTLSMEELRI
jgi:hypothetical protein